MTDAGGSTAGGAAAASGSNGQAGSTAAPGPSTLSVHGGAPRVTAEPGGSAPLTRPLDRASTSVCEDAAYRSRLEGDPYSIPVYSREANPTVMAVEERLAALERAECSLLWASGMAALHGALLAVVERGGQVAVSSQSYGGTFSLLRALAPKLEFELVEFDVSDPDSLARAVDDRLQLAICESLSNPTSIVADLPALAAHAHAAGGRLLVDATFVTPLGQRPLEHGADLVWHSASKYLGGHSDLIGGVLSGSVESLALARDWRTRAGGSADPEMAWLLDRGLKTLALRLDRATGNARAIAAFLSAHPRVVRVHHVSTAGSEQRALAGRLLEREGGVLSFEVEGGDEVATAVMRRMRYFAEAPSFGGVESLISPPARMSHAGLDAASLERVGIGSGCLRLAAGIEDTDDLLADLDQALGS